MEVPVPALSNVPANLKYTEDHEWVLEEAGGIIKMGITDHAQDALGDIVFFESPPTGVAVDKGDEFCVVESVKAVSDVYAPLSGTIVEVNEALADTPELINESPYKDGWLVKIETLDPAEIDELMDAEAYIAFLETA